MTDEGKINCSFCGKEKKDVLTMISSNQKEGIYICDECVALCEEIILDNLRRKRLSPNEDRFNLDRELIKMVPKELAVYYQFVPLFYKTNYLVVAGVSSDKKHEVIKLLRFYALNCG